VGFPPSAAMRARLPSSWPLQNGRLTCLTCHDALPQMQANAVPKFLSPAFLRGNPDLSPADFCFSCHDRQRFQKLNPHEQIDGNGNIIAQRCRMCHKTMPDRSAVRGIEAADLKSGTAICIGCHADLQNRHPARADHLRAAPADMRRALAAHASAGGPALPLLDGNIVCGTCHDPHQPGVLPGSRRPVDAPHLLRLNGGRQLCVACHADHDVQAKPFPPTVAPANSLSTAVQHKPHAEKKCKACHARAPGQTDRPLPVLLCLREGCHKADIIDQGHAHEKSVLGSCTFCHQSHTSDHAKLLRIDTERACSVCHPLVRNAAGQTARVDHDLFEPYAARAGMPPDQVCSACHSPAHNRNVSTATMALCADCHEYVRRVASANPHKDYADKACTSCHDPHASPHEFQLKKPLETYSQAR